MFVDYYEILQISANADPETVRRMYRIQAQRFHPDNQDTGDAEKFKKISQAYEVLADPERRAAYDREHREARRREAIGVFEPPPIPPVMDEEHRRDQILLLLYRQKRAHPEQPSISLREFEVLLQTPREHLEFSLWYLKESGYLLRTDNARHTITLKGVQFAESQTLDKAPSDNAKSDQAKCVEGS